MITTNDRRGAEVFALDLEHCFRERGFRPLTVALAPGTTAAPLAVPVLGSSRLGRATLLALRRRIRAASVVVGHGSSTLAACSLAGLGTGVPFIYRQIGDSLYWASTTTKRLQVRAALRRADAVVSLSEGAAQTLIDHFGVERARLTVIPNGVPGARFAPASVEQRKQARQQAGLPEDAEVVLYIGALVAEKAVDIAVRAIAALPSRACLVIVGAGPERADLERLAASAAPGRVHFLGAMNSPAIAYAAADVVVLPSTSEGMPGVLIEAGLCGVPAVGSAVGAIPDVIVPGVTGRLVTRTTPGELAAAVEDTLENAAAYGAAARLHCLERFEIGVVAGAWGRLLERIAPETSGR